jgi:hypothetical protein
LTVVSLMNSCFAVRGTLGDQLQDFQFTLRQRFGGRPAYLPMSRVATAGESTAFASTIDTPRDPNIPL